jgi:alpha-L-rhamnosidase
MSEYPFFNAKYIKAQEAPSAFSLYDPIPLFRKEFELDSEIEMASIFVQSPGFAEYYINGKRITEDVFISAVSDYGKILWYDEYDVTALLRKGKNTVGVIVGNGFFNESFRTPWVYNEAPFRDAPQFLLSLVVNGESVLVSDGSFRASKEHSPIIYSHLRSGEYYDARKADDSWLCVGYDDSDWCPAVEREKPITAQLKRVPCQPVREKEIWRPRSIVPTESGYLVDFGVTMSGYAEVTLKAEAGDEIVFRYTEEVDENLRPKYNRMNAKHFYPESPFHVNKMIASGAWDTFKPKFSYHGFRYVLIEGLREAPSPDSIRAYFIHQDVARRSSFTSGNEVLNYIYEAGIRSTYSNLFWSLTDCPTREKLGWANDAQASVEQALINFDIVPLFRKWFEDLKSSMREDGALPGIIPSSGWGFDAGPICDGLLYELPYRVYLYTGDVSMLMDAIPYFERYSEYLSGMIAKGHTFTYGDWMGYTCSKVVPKDFVRDFYYMKALSVTAFAHKLQGTDVQKWSERYEREREAFLSRYLDTEGRCTIDQQSSLAMLLMTGLYRDRETIQKQLVAAVERDELRLTSGMVGVQYLYHALSECGRADLAYRMITETEPGYRTWWKHGATTLWERWEGEEDGSHNHHMFAGVISWFYRSLLGIEPKESAPAFREIELCPRFVRALGSVSGHMETVRGRIEAAWRFEENGVRYTVTLPEGMEATFRGEKLRVGKNEFFIG